MPFEVDTGEPQRDAKPYSLGNPVQHIVDNVRDGLPADAPDEAADGPIITYLLGWLREPKTAPTIMRRLGMCAETLTEIAERDPRLVLGVVSEVAERLDRLC